MLCLLLRAADVLVLDYLFLCGVSFLWCSYLVLGADLCRLGFFVFPSRLVSHFVCVAGAWSMALAGWCMVCVVIAARLVLCLFFGCLPFVVLVFY